MRKLSRRAATGASVLTFAALGLAACSSGPTMHGAASGQTAIGGDAITITNFMFSPMSLTVAPGATVRVTNMDSAVHTLTASGGQFNTGNIADHQTKTFQAPMTPGTYHYICNIHQFMTGTIKVS